MNTIEQSADPDTEALIDSIASGKPLDAETRDRLRAEGGSLTEELRRTFGAQRISADLIREVRDES